MSARTDIGQAKRLVSMSDEEKVLLAEYHAAGYNRRHIGRLMNHSWQSVVRAGNELGLDFSEDPDLVVTRRSEMAQMRAILAFDLLDRAQQIMDRLDEPFTVFSFGGRDNVFSSQVLDSPPPEALQKLIGAATQAAMRSIDLVKFDEDRQTTAAATSIFEQVVEGIRKFVDEHETPKADNSSSNTPESDDATG